MGKHSTNNSDINTPIITIVVSNVTIMHASLLKNLVKESTAIVIVVHAFHWLLLL